MILTITLNPSVDRRYTLEKFEKGKLFRTDNVQYTPGGKGLNVTKVIKSFQESVMATGFIGGYSGEYILSELDKFNVDHNFISIDGETRSCLAIISNNGVQTEILENGPVITKGEIIKFINLYQNIVGDYDIIVASGSLPKGLPASIYRDLVKIVKDKGKKFILDTSGEALKYGIEASPFLVKPNKDELEKHVGKSIESEDDIIEGARCILNKGVDLVVVSLGEKGSMVFHDNKIYRVRVPKVEAINPVGSGDAMIAGFAISLVRNYDFDYMLKFSAACGTANAMEAETGKVNKDNIKLIMDRIIIEEIH